ncbi:hypothetical protein CKM354_000435000 [Cercospora kikuchii]|uniref:Uncharacterized protein n=1 Tax=Cercospora kikuchii TaxID=84275 RepID=A0A9P3CDZ2_9PEZI|nr:uncharacterized protein CKM354_000435000 [Cercospora kikuchii]GIZ41033.1 hypothetical protein CKM354_000435000 [Cercospora kikuchii]
MSTEDEDPPSYQFPFAVCCATDLSVDLMNHFLDLNKHNNDPSSEPTIAMTFFDQVDNYLSSPSVPPVQKASNPSSPFKGKSAQQCYLLLRQMVQVTGSEFNWEEFVIVDERTLEDNSVQLVSRPNIEEEEEEESNEAISVRVLMHLAQDVLFTCASGKTDVEEVRAMVSAPKEWDVEDWIRDGVLVAWGGKTEEDLN